ncbi:GntR family transcriptional regulator [Mongoliitalea lutea]|uniref:GntR family transcriptional regulator n=1 Tax=Mongoliitalea lutea TaxID=849756 RepID=A0A8J3D086_9BACT|nr:GntR family transcriptional regulator [Mongoliitalea lutea]GHB52319.1 GntR family transcriptional regulator [Mongoliitalea lutea]
MEFSEHKNIFLQIGDWVYEQILDGRLQPGDKLPSVRELAVELEVNRNTAMRTYQVLEKQGVLENKRGIGFYVSDTAPKVILNRQKKEFFAEELPLLIQKVKLLKLTSEDLQELILTIQQNDYEN